MMMSLCKMSLASGYSQMRLKKRLFSFFSSSSHLSNKPKQSYLTPSYQPCNMAYSQQCDINNAQSRSLFSLKKICSIFKHCSHISTFEYMYSYPVCCWEWAGAPSWDESCVSWWWLRLLLCRSSSSRSLWTRMDRINRTHVARAVCLLGFGKSKASLSE